MKCPWKNGESDFFSFAKAGIFILLVAGTALFMTRFTFDSFDLPKKAWIEFWIKALACLYLGGLLFKKSFRVMFSPINALLFVYLVLHLISGFVAGSPSLWKEETIRIGFLFLFALMLQDYLYGNRRRVFLLIWALSISAFITALWTLYEDVTARFFPHLSFIRPRLADWRGFLSAGLGNSGYIGDYLAVLFPMNVLLYLHARGKMREIYLLLTLLVSFAALVVCWSVQSNAGLILGAIVLMYFLIKYKTRRFWKRRRLRIAALVMGFLLVVLLYSSPLPFNPHKPSIFNQAFASKRWEYGWESRLVIWAQTLEIARTHPWLGTGAGNFTWQYVQQASPFLLTRERLLYIGMYSNAGHNEILQSWAELGIMGPALLFVLLALIWRSLVKPLCEDTSASRWIRIGGLCALVCAFIPAMMAYPLRLPTSSLLFFALCSLPVVLLPMKKGSSETMIVPVEFSWNIFHADVLLENFHKPVGGEIRLDVPLQYARLGAIIIFFFFLPWGFQSIRPIISDALFKEGKTWIETYQMGLVDHTRALKGEKALRQALAWWPENHDCRSTLGQYLYREGRFEEALYQLFLTSKRLQAREIYEFLGRSLDALGRTEEAGKAYQLFFDRNPIMQAMKTELYQRYLLLKKTGSNP